MGFVYVARSAALTDWGSDVGLGKFVFKLGYAEDAEAAVKALNDSAAGGAADWALVGKAEADTSEQTVLERLGRKEKTVDPAFYPRLKGLTGLFKVKLANVENHLLVKAMMENREAKPVKPKPADIAGYLIHNATR